MKTRQYFPPRHNGCSFLPSCFLLTYQRQKRKNNLKFFARTNRGTRDILSKQTQIRRIRCRHCHHGRHCHHCHHVIHCHPLSPLSPRSQLSLRSPLSPTVIRCRALSSTVIQCHPLPPLSSIVIHCDPLSSTATTVIHCHPLSSTVTHCRPLPSIIPVSVITVTTVTYCHRPLPPLSPYCHTVITVLSPLVRHHSPLIPSSLTLPPLSVNSNTVQRHHCQQYDHCHNRPPSTATADTTAIKP
jgi:hypothetical protein